MSQSEPCRYCEKGVDREDGNFVVFAVKNSSSVLRKFAHLNCFQKNRAEGCVASLAGMAGSLTGQ